MAAAPDLNPYPTALRARADALAKRLLGALTPIYKDGPRHPLLVGSGVLVGVGTETVLLTAAHVVDELATGPTYFGCGGELHPLPSCGFVSSIPGDATRDDDPVDLAYFVLDPAQRGRLSSADVLHPTALELLPRRSRPDDLFLLYGYPHRRQPRQLDQDGYEARTYTLLTSEQSAAAYAGAGVDSATHLFVHFDKADTWRGAARVDGPDLHGVSGGGVWRLSGILASPDVTPKLSAIATTWHRGALKGVRATRLHAWGAALRTTLPALGDALYAEAGAQDV